MSFSRFTPYLACTLSLFSSLSAEELYWENVAIKGGGYVSGIIFSETTPNLLYARTDVGGAYRWNPIERKWIPLNDELRGKDNIAFLYGILSLALDPQNPGNVCTENGCYLSDGTWNTEAVLFSDNNGITWRDSHIGKNVKFGGNVEGRGTGERLLVDPHNSDTIYAGTQLKGIYKSDNKGKSWSHLSFPKNSVYWILADASSGANGSDVSDLYAFGNHYYSYKIDSEREKWDFEDGSLYVSHDAGKSWDAIPGIPEKQIILQARIVDGYLYAVLSDNPGPYAIEKGSVKKLNLKTREWTDLNAPAGQGGFAGLAVDPSNPNHIIVSTAGRWYPKNDLFRTTDGGKTWNSVFDSSDWDYRSAPYVEDKNPHWITDVEIDPFNPNRVIFTTGYGLFVTQNLSALDKGKKIKWSFMCDGLEETVPLDLVCPPTGAPLHSAIGDIGGCRHVDVFQSPPREDWYQEGGNAVSIDFSAQKPEFMVRSHWNEKRGSYSKDGGVTWTFFKTAPNDAAPGYVAMSGDASSIIYMSSDGINQWTSEEDAKHMVNDFRPRYSKDFGDSWDLCKGLPKGNYHPVADPVLAHTFYVYCSKNGKVYRSDDGGANFDAIDRIKRDGGKICSIPEKEGYLLIPHWEGLFISKNGGEDFKRLTTLEQAYEVAAGPNSSGGETPAIYCWGKINGVEGIYLSEDYGKSWERINNHFQQFGNINTMAADLQNPGRIYIGTGGRGLIVGHIAKGFKAWQMRHFNALQRKEPFISAHYVDLDRDGYDNYMEYAMVKDAYAEGETLLSSSVISGSTAQDSYYALRFLKPSEISIDIYQFQGSADGSNWTELKVDPSWKTVTLQGDGIDEVVFKIPATFNTQGSRSFRIYIPIKDRFL